jgi:predicted SAM-dependent methyltransferase
MLSEVKHAVLRLPGAKRLAKISKPIRFWLRRGHLVRKWIIREWLNETDSPRLLQVGGGEYTIPGALNGDVIAGDVYLDASKTFPLPSESIDYIFTEQFIEHLSFEEGKRFAREAYRVLRPGGVIRQATPSLRGLIEVYEDRNEHVSQKDAISRHISNHQPLTSGDLPAKFINDFFRLWGHEFIYDRETLELIHKDAGFSSFEWKKFGMSSHEILSDRERHEDVKWMKSAFCLVCEAQKGREENTPKDG